jgi:hypothetical protein
VQFVDEEQDLLGKINSDVDFRPERLDGAFGSTAKNTARIVTNSGDKP